MGSDLLSRITDSSQLKKIPIADLPTLADEIRERLITTLSRTGGHLGPNLGVVELSIALHYVFSTPKDKFVFDVSHQGYIHKILTGRNSELETIRQPGGISGFLNRSESPHDSFGAGHAGTALSAALGMAAARDIHNDPSHIVAISGDAAFTCGVTLEALNNIAAVTKRFIVVLNDNEWSIDRNVGAIASYLNSLQSHEAYSWLRKKASVFAERVGGKAVKDFIHKVEGSAKGLIMPSVLFEKFGLRYFGPIDGHDVNLLIRSLEYVKTLDEPVILHVITEKGRGYQPALDNPGKFHGLGTYCVVDGSTPPVDLPTYSEVFANSVSRFADDDSSMVAITAAMPGGTKLEVFKKNHPARYFDTGIAEEHAAVFAAGLATDGIRPFLAIYSTFMQRAFDMLHHDIALQNLPVRLCMDRAGLSSDDGPTHHGLFDISFIRCLPNMILMQPKDEAEFVDMLWTMKNHDAGPTAIRYPRGTGTGAKLPGPGDWKILPIGQAEVVSRGKDVLLLGLGNMFALAEQTARLLEAEGYSVSLVNPRFIKPLDTDAILPLARDARVVVTFEDHVRSGGFGSAVLEAMNAAGIETPVEMVAWPDEFIEHGKLDGLRLKYGLTSENGLALARKWLAGTPSGAP